jgi:hypothetical protein
MKVYKFSEFKSQFNSEIEKSPDLRLLIRNEIDDLLGYINYIPNLRELKRGIKPSYNTKNKFDFLDVSVFHKSLLNSAFNEEIRTGKFRLAKIHTDTDETFQMKLEAVEQGGELFKYYQWLNKTLDSPQKTQKKSSLSHKQKILALHYLGFDMMKFNQTKTGFVLEEVLGLNAKNTTDYIRYVSAGKNDVRTLENLTKVKQLFEKQGLYDIADKIDSEIPKTK